MKINPNNIVIESGGHFWRHHVVRLVGNESISQLRESTEAFAAVQSNINSALRRGDEVTAISSDGLVIADRMRVTRTLGMQVWLSAPLRLVSLEADGLFAAGVFEIVPLGTSYAIKNTRDGSIEQVAFASVEAAKQEILRRQPTRNVA